ncbi:S-linalool synthase-like [Fagus crenata]
MDLSQYSSIQSQVDNIKENMFSDVDPYSFISPSAYDTAWLAMIPNPHQPSQPMFENCLDWVLNNQKEEGFWGECGAHGMPTIECLPATLACIVALKKWNVGTIFINKGIAFVRANTEKLIREMNHHCPRWFAIVFPSMVELAQTVGVHLVFFDGLSTVVSELFNKQQQILEKEKLADKYTNPPLLSYLEALPASYDIDQDDIIKHLSNDGSLFQSPSATARAFMVTGNKKCLAYLLSLVQRCDNGVPPTYPIDEELIKLCMVNQLLRLGFAEHFVQEIEEVLAQVYRNYKNQESWGKPSVEQLFKDSLAFWLLRMHGYDVSSDSFCWFLHHEDIRDQIQINHEYFSSAMLNVYRATDLTFSGEYDLQDARSFSKKLLEKTTSVATREQTHIEHELRLPWLARLDHLEHRRWIEDHDANVLWMGKASSHRLSCPHNSELVGLAMHNFLFRQSIYKYELEELKRWSKDMGLSDIGFGREKTTYCYFAVAASSTLPYDSEIRMIVAKSAIVITVADDFFDMEGSLIELKGLTNAVQRWDAKGLRGHGKIIFDALDNLVSELASKYLQKEGRDITKSLQDIWYETFDSWHTESKWIKTGYVPSMNEYLETGMISIATHTMVLPASCFLKPSLPNSKIKPVHYENITKLLMVIARLLNDIQSYQKEKDEGKMNFVLLYLKDNPEADIEEAIACSREILDKKKKDLLQHVLIDGYSDLPKPCKNLHLSCMKVFQMFFNSANRYDSNTEMLEDIKKGIYIPLEVGTSKPLKPLALYSGEKKTYQTVKYQINQPSKNFKGRSFGVARVSLPALRYHGHGKTFMLPKVRLSFA